MNLSSMPELRAYRNELAESCGGDKSAALAAANLVTKRIYDKAIRDTGKPRRQLSDRAVREVVARTVRGVRSGTIVLESGGGQVQPRKKKKQQDKTAIGEVATQTAGRAVAETVDQRVKRRVSAAITEFVQEAATAGLIDPRRAALVLGEDAAPSLDKVATAGELQKMPDDEFTAHFGAWMAARAAETAPPQAVSEALGVLVREAVIEGVLPQSQANAVLRENGIVAEDNAPTPEEMRAMPDDEFRAYFGAAAVADLDRRPRVPSPFMRGLDG